jgi:ABC-type Fe3+ transport system substrate-binding protein
MLKRAAGIVGKGALLLLVSSLALWPWDNSRAAETAGSSLSKLVQGAKAEPELNLVGGGGTWGDADALAALEKGVNRKYGLNAKINLVPGPSMPDMARRIADEYKAGQKSATDLFLGSESHFVELTRSDALTRFPWRDAFPHIPSAMIEMDGRLLREATRYIGVSYNQQVISEKDLPRRLDDLLKPTLKGKIASTPYAASFDRLASIIGVEKTREFLKRFTQNVAGLVRCGEEERLASGEFVLLALNCGNYDADRGRRQGMPIGARVLTDVPIVGYWYLSIPKKSAHPNLAMVFAAFLLTPEGQRIRNESVGATAHLVEGTPANKQYKEFLAQGIQLKDFTAEYVIKNDKKLGELREEFQKIMQQR